MKVIFTIVFCLLAIAQLTAQVLEKYEWKNRLVLLFTNDPQQQVVVEQKKELLSVPNEFSDRDLLLFVISTSAIVDEHGKAIPSLNPDNLRDQYDVSQSKSLTFILIGKDGNEKLHSEEIVTKDKLWEIIDAMPMRQREMRNN